MSFSRRLSSVLFSALLITGFASMLALTSCEGGKNEIVTPDSGNSSDPGTNPGTVVETSVSFDLNAVFPKFQDPIKGDWDKDDVIFVFLSSVASPKYLKMKYDGTAWTYTEMNGDASSKGVLGLKNGDSGKMYAVYMPFGGDLQVELLVSSFKFNDVRYSYYLTAEAEYTVKDDKLSGTLNMAMPEGYISFYVEDAEAKDGAYFISSEAFLPYGILYISKDGVVVETKEDTLEDFNLPGFAYKGGYLFGGRLKSDYGHGQNYYLSLVKSDDGSRADYFLEEVALSNAGAYKLPKNGDKAWQKADASETVTLKGPDGESLGTWYFCNKGATKPEELGTLFSTEEARELIDSMPSRAMYQSLTSSCSFHWMKINGTEGALYKAHEGFLFIPSNLIGTNYLSEAWCKNASSLWFLRVPKTGSPMYLGSASGSQKPLRQVVD